MENSNYLDHYFSSVPRYIFKQTTIPIQQYKPDNLNLPSIDFNDCVMNLEDIFEKSRIVSVE